MENNMENTEIKTLANCTPEEFLKQTVKIKKSVREWLEITKILEIRKERPSDLIEITLSMSAEEKEAAKAANIEKQNKQISKNLSKMFDRVFEENPQKTLEIMALACFTEPQDVNEHPMSYYFGALNEMLSDSNVTGFFISLVRLANTNI